MRWLYISLGTISMSLGFIGLFVPLMPSTIFFILAAVFYAKSSKKLYNYLINHPKVSKSIKLWQEERAMPKKAKIIAIISILISLTIVFLLNKLLIVKLGAIILGISCILIILRIRTA